MERGINIKNSSARVWVIEKKEKKKKITKTSTQEAKKERKHRKGVTKLEQNKKNGKIPTLKFAGKERKLKAPKKVRKKWGPEKKTDTYNGKEIQKGNSQKKEYRCWASAIKKKEGSGRSRWKNSSEGGGEGLEKWFVKKTWAGRNSKKGGKLTGPSKGGAK